MSKLNTHLSVEHSVGLCGQLLFELHLNILPLGFDIKEQNNIIFMIVVCLFSCVCVCMCECLCVYLCVSAYVHLCVLHVCV